METNPGAGPSTPVDLGTVTKTDITDVAVDIAKDNKPMKKKTAKKPAAKKTKPVKKAAKPAKSSKPSKKSKAGHKAQGQVSMEEFKALQAYAKKNDIREAAVVRIAVQKLLGIKPTKD